MFWNKKSKMEEPAKSAGGKLPKPDKVPEVVANCLVNEMNVNPAWAWSLKAVLRPRAEGNAYDIRLFHEPHALAKRIKVADYTMLDDYPDLVLYEGLFDETSAKVQLIPKHAT